MTTIKPTDVTYTQRYLETSFEAVRPEMLVNHLEQQEARIKALEYVVGMAVPVFTPPPKTEPVDNGLPDGWYHITLSGDPQPELRHKQGGDWFNENGKRTNERDPNGATYDSKQFLGTEKPKTKESELPDGWYAVLLSETSLHPELVRRINGKWHTSYLINCYGGDTTASRFHRVQRIKL